MDFDEAHRTSEGVCEASKRVCCMLLRSGEGRERVRRVRVADVRD